jgi:DNA segregation ATPase FtsK/SpoIIIE-like protein
MGYKDDYEYEDDEEYYDDDEEYIEYDEDDDESSSGSSFRGGSGGSSAFKGGNSSRFGGSGSGSGGLPGSSSSGSRFGAGGSSRFGGKSEDEDEDEEEGGGSFKSGSGSRFGGGGSGGNASRFGGGGDKKDESSSGSRFGGGSSSFGSGSSSNPSRFGGGGDNKTSTGSNPKVGGGSNFGGGGSGNTSRFGGGGDNKTSTGSNPKVGDSSGSRFGGGGDKKDDSSSGSRFGGGGSSFGSGGSGGSNPSRFGGGGDKKDDSSSASRFGGGGSNFGGGGNNSGNTSRFGGGDNKTSTGSNPKVGGGSSFGGGNKPEDKKDDKPAGGGFGGNRFGGGNKPEEKKDDKPAGGGLGGIANRFGGGNKPEEKKDDKAAGGGLGGFTNRFGGGGNKPEEKKDDKPAGGGLGGFTNRFGGGNKPEEKKDDKPAGGGLGGFTNRFGGGNKPEEKKDDKPAGGGLGGFTNRFGGGNKPEEKKDDKPAGGLGGFSNRFGSGSKEEEKKDDKPAGGGFGGNRFGSQSADKPSSPTSTGSMNRFGGGDNKTSTGSSSSVGGDNKTGTGQFNRFGGDNKTSTGSSPKAGDNKTSTGSSPKTGGFGASDKKDDKPAGQSPFGQKVSTQGKDDPKAGDKGSKTAAATVTSAPASGGFLGKVTGLFGGNKAEEKAPSKAASTKAAGGTKASKVPVAKTDEGLTLDNWLDIIGVALVFSSFILFFSALSQEQAAIGGIHVFIGQLFGWGSWIVPITMLLIGGWLIVRHFGDKAPTVDPLRVVGVAIFFLCLLVIFQYVDSFSYLVPANVNSTDLLNQFLQTQLNIAWEVRRSGGGIIGAQIYYFFVSTVTEIGGVFVLVFAIVIGSMLVFKMSAAEIVRASGGLFMNAREKMKNQAVQRRAERSLATQRAAEEQARIAASLTASQELAAAQAYAAPMPTQPMPVAADSGREIRLSLGGQAQTVNMQGQQQAAVPLSPQTVYQQAPAVPYAAPQQSSNNAAGGGLFGRFGRGNNNPAPAAPQAPPPPLMPDSPLPMDDGYSHFDTGPMRPAAQSAPTPRLGDMLRPQSAPEPATFTPPSAARNDSTPAPAPSAAAQQTEEMNDFLKQRQERLNALREGQTGPLSQSALARARQEDATAAVVPSNESQREVQATPEPAVFTPPSKLPSVTMDTDDKPKQQMLEVEVDKPLSSAVTNVTRAQRPDWKLPDYHTLLSSGSEQEFDKERLLKQAKMIEETLESFGSPGRVVEVNTGPVITQFGVEPDYIQGRSGKKQRVKVSAIAALDKDLQLALGARSIRVEAPVPGKGYVGIEVPNAESTIVSLRDVMDAPSFAKYKSPLTIALGQSVSGAPISADLATMPHLLIAGTTGSGKSVCVNSIIASIISKNTPEQVKFIMVDPKRVELTGYNGIPHLVAPVVVELERIVGVLKWVTREMDARYKRFSEAGARNIDDYNKHRDPNTTDPMPYMVVIIDELADLMMLAPEETERTITRIAALARATGIHLVIATQRPSVDVVTGLIKANFPARIAFAVAGSVDSRVILDQPGAERLLGKGDMLWMSGDSPAPLRLQGVFVSDMEINNIVRYWKMQALQVPDNRGLTLAPKFVAEDMEKPKSSDGKKAFWDGGGQASLTEDLPLFAAAKRATPSAAPAASYADEDEDFDDEEDYDDDGDVAEGDEDDLYDRAVEMVRRLDKASVSLLQRRLRIGYTRAARLIDVMEARGIIGPAKDGSSKPRDVLQDKL